MGPKTITDVTAWLIATVSLFVATGLVGFTLYLVRKYWLEPIEKKVNHAEKVAQRMEEVLNLLDQEKALATLKGEVKALTSMMSGVSTTLTGIGADHLQSLRREMQRLVKEEVTKLVEKEMENATKPKESV